MKIEKEDFDQWRGHPVTEQVFVFLKAKAEECKELWLAASWGNGDADPIKLAQLKGQASNLLEICELTFEDISDEERERDIPDRVQDSGSAEAGRGEV